MHDLRDEILDAVSAGIVVWELSDDGSLRLRYANRAASRLSDVRFDGQIGKRLRDLIPSVPPERYQLYLELCRKRQAREIGRVQHRDAKGIPSTFVLKVVPVGRQAICVIFENLSEERLAALSATGDTPCMIMHL